MLVFFIKSALVAGENDPWYTVNNILKMGDTCMDKFLGELIIFLFFALPASAVVWFIVSLVGFFMARKQKEEQPDRFRRWRRSLVASAIVAGVLVAICVGIIALLVAALAHM